MGTGHITEFIDIAQFVLYLFWIFFAGLCFYLVRENHREGYPMVTDNGVKVTGWPIPKPKTFKLAHGGEVSYPNDFVSPQVLAAEPAHRWAGAPLVPTGNPMIDGVGPASWSDRADRPDVTFEGVPKIVPLHTIPDYGIAKGDIDPRGLPVVGADGVVGGKVVELWMDTAELLFRYLELEAADGSRRIMLPINFARIRRNEVRVGAILGSQFAAVPATRKSEIITLLEEEKIAAYYGGGTLYAEPSRSEPLL